MNRNICLENSEYRVNFSSLYSACLYAWQKCVNSHSSSNDCLIFSLFEASLHRLYDDKFDFRRNLLLNVTETVVILSWRRWFRLKQETGAHTGQINGAGGFWGGREGNIMGYNLGRGFFLRVNHQPGWNEKARGGQIGTELIRAASPNCWPGNFASGKYSFFRARDASGLRSFMLEFVIGHWRWWFTKIYSNSVV